VGTTQRHGSAAASFRRQRAFVVRARPFPSTLGGMNLADLLGLKGKNLRFQTRGWIRFQLIVFGIFTPMEVAYAIGNGTQRDWWAALGFGLAACLFAFLLAFSIKQWRALPDESGTPSPS
jgi:hypothetical protein